MGFILDGLDTENYDRSYSDRELVRRIVGYFRPYRLKMVAVAALILLNSAAGTAAPILVSNTLDRLGLDAYDCLRRCVDPCAWSGRVAGELRAPALFGRNHRRCGAEGA